MPLVSVDRFGNNSGSIHSEPNEVFWARHRNAMFSAESWPSAILFCSLTAIFACACLGLISGLFVTMLRVPSFIVTLAMMLLADGLAYNLSQGATIDEIPIAFTWLGKGTLWRIPNSAVI